MELSNKTINLENVIKKIFFIYHCEYTVKSFFETLLPNSKVEDGYLLYYEGKEYEIYRLEVVGVDLQRDINIYKLTEIPNDK
jgi:hypothetical protein